MNERRDIFKQSLLASLRGQVPPVVGGRMVFEGIVITEQKDSRTNFDRDIEGEEIYDESKRIRDHGSKKNVQNVEKAKTKGEISRQSPTWRASIYK